MKMTKMTTMTMTMMMMTTMVAALCGGNMLLLSPLLVYPAFFAEATASASVPTNEADGAISVFFAPRDGFSQLRQELGLIDTVIARRKSAGGSAGNSSIDLRFSVRYCVYNLLNDDITERLCKAHAAGGAQLG